MTITRLYASGIGIAFILAGIGGMLPLVTSQPEATAPELLLTANYGYLLGLFPVNLLHNLFHFVTGVLGIWASRQEQTARYYCRGLALVLGVFSIMGLLPSVSTLFGLMPLFGHDVWLHGLEAAIAGYLGFFWREPVRQTRLGAQ